MGLFDPYYRQIRTYLSEKHSQGKVRTYGHRGPTVWPVSRDRNLVLGLDTAVELGSPREVSTSFLLWRNQVEDIVDGRIWVVGPDLPELMDRQAPFGKIVIVGGQDFNAENSYPRYREMEPIRYDIHLKGYMLRGVSQVQREWSRISREAMDNGFSFRVLGGALMDKLSELAYVRGVEVIFITSSREDVIEIQTEAQGVMQRIGAMNKMATELSFDCDTCAYANVCADVSELRAMRSAISRKEAGGRGQTSA